MKKFKIFKLLLFIFFVLAFVFHAHSQLVNFQAIHTIKGGYKDSTETVILDSVKILDASTGNILLTTNESSVDLANLGYSEDNNYNSLRITKLIISESKILNMEFINNESFANLKIYDILGRELYAKDYNDCGANYCVTIDCSVLPKGLFFILLSNSKQTISNKFINDNNFVSVSRFSAAKKTERNPKTVEIEEAKAYNFIGFANGYYNETLSNVFINNDTTITFNLLKFYTYNSGKIEFNAPQFKIAHNFSSSYPYSDPHSHTDTLISFGWTKTFTNTEGVFNAMDEDNGGPYNCYCYPLINNDTMYFCDIIPKISGFNLCSDVTRVNISLDINKLILKKFIYYFYSSCERLVEPPYFFSESENLKTRLSLNNIPYSIDLDGNIIINVNGNLLKDAVDNINYSWKTHKFSGGGSSQQSKSFISTEYDDDTYLKITIYRNK